ncbi:MAG: YjgP/YjgQ family permease, partial [bacterium]|nr:YjgP/YjgQ family permease [bacterium]
MGILDRYIIREFLRMLVLGVAALVLVSTVVSIFGRLGTIIQHKPSVWDVIGYFFTRIPQDLFLIAPISMLLTTLIVIGAFAHNSEIVAMLAGGVSVYRIMAPILAIGFVMSLAMFGLNEFVVPVSNRLNLEFWRRIKKKPDISQMAKPQIWFRGRRKNSIRDEDENRIYHINMLIPAGRKADGTLKLPELQGLTVFELNEQFTPIKRLDAAWAVYNKPKGTEERSAEKYPVLKKFVRDLRFWGDRDRERLKVSGSWTLHDGSRRSLDINEQGSQKITSFKEVHDYVIPWTFDQFRRDRKSPVDMSYRELKAYIQILTESGFDVSEYIVDLRAKFSYPFVSFVMV